MVRQNDIDTSDMHLAKNPTYLAQDQIQLVIQKTIENGEYVADLWFETADTNDSYPVKIGVNVDISTFDSGLGPDNATKATKK